MARARPQLVVGLTAVAVLGGCTSEERRTEAPSRIGPSVILVLGDGMAAAHREAGRLDQVGLDGQLAMGSMPVTGEQTTDSADPDDPVTDSAAAATALATGQKTYNGAISVDVDGDPLTPLGVEAAEAGKATGLVTTAEVNDASPAAFFANASDRDEEADIITQYLEDTGPDVVLGGGAEEWQDLLDEAEDGGYTHVTDADELDGVRGDRLLGLFAEDALYPDDDEDPERPSPVPLADMTRSALDVLSRDPDGFFLLVEEEGIDSAGHRNDAELLLASMRSLDAAVAVAREYVAEHPDTLLVVTGDHDSGGLTVQEGEQSGGPGGQGGETFPVADSDRTFTLTWATDGHTSIPVPVTAEGPGSEQLAGTYPNTRIHDVLRGALLR